jgi:hypothetical protein
VFVSLVHKDWDPQCRQALAANTTGCIFTDILDQVDCVPVFDARWSYETQRDVIQQARVREVAWCSRHGDYCRVPTGHLDVSGTPCTDVTPSGLQLGIEQGPTSFVHLAWCRVKTVRRTPFLWHENVLQFPWQFALERNLPDYQLWQFETHPRQAGFNFARRHRQMVLGCDVHQARMQYDFFAIYDKVCDRLATNATIADAMIAEPLEILQEAQHLCAVRGIWFRPGDLNLRYTLSAREVEYEAFYANEWFHRFRKPPSLFACCLFGLNDNPTQRMSWSAVHGQIPTLRRNSNRVFSPSCNRCLTLTERLASMGWPVCTRLAQAAMCPVMSANSAMAGNGMHLPNIMAAITTALACMQLV